MGILNATPDSFYNKGQDSDADSLLRNAEKMLKDGATILDIGGASSKPGSPLITPEAELERIVPVIKLMYHHFPEAWLSVDTYNAAVAEAAVAEGVAIINDISAGDIDTEMLATVARLKVLYIAMHMQGTPETMQLNPQYTDAVIEVRNYLNGKVKQCADAGITDVIIDPGFGFGKTTAHNFALLREMHTLRMAGKPILAGISRKSIVCKPLQVSPAHALNGTTALHMVALQQGASILRVHDVREAMEVIRLFEILVDG
jgi:dihydropteroate synthase